MEKFRSGYCVPHEQYQFKHILGNPYFEEVMRYKVTENLTSELKSVKLSKEYSPLVKMRNRNTYYLKLKYCK